MQQTRQERDKIEDEKRLYHLQDMEYLPMIGLKNKFVGLESGKYMEVSFMYNFRYDLDLGISNAACRRIPCICLTSLEILKTP